MRCVITDMGVYEKPPGEDELALTANFPHLGGDARGAVEIIRSRCGWEIDVSESLREAQPPDLDDLYVVRIFDPRRHFLG
ncbi:MAG: hypothetical protein SWK76_12930 [Actinomycetota bacterium]|nr:hypothetical protein [Actinomycetota bacterium]